MANQFTVGQIYYSPHFKKCFKIYADSGIERYPVLQDCDVFGDTSDWGDNKPFGLDGENAIYLRNCVLITDENRIEYSRKLQVGENLQRACDLLWNLQRMHGVEGLIPIIKQLQAIQP